MISSYNVLKKISNCSGSTTILVTKLQFGNAIASETPFRVFKNCDETEFLIQEVRKNIIEFKY